MATSVDPRAAASLADAQPRSFWLDDPAAPPAAAALTATTRADLVVVGGGYTGLWTALHAKAGDPARDVVVLEAATCGWAASGRNGGFCNASLTHGLPNGVERFADELPTLLRLGRENLDGMEKDLARLGIDAQFERTGELDVATQAWQVEELAEVAATAAAYGLDWRYLDGDATRAAGAASPSYLAGLLDADGSALVHPGLLAWGLRTACLAAGVRIYENTPARSLERDGAGMRVTTPYGAVRAAKVALATNAFPSLLRRVRPYLVPVWDYVLVTEPLSPAQREAIGWSSRVGIGDAGNQFHYYRLTADHRILWGGYDAVYYYGSAMGADKASRPSTYLALAGQFFDTFPQLEGLRFSHAWGGAIDTCTRFTAFWGSGYDGRVGYVAGYTGLGVAATRFGAQVLLDRLDGADTEATRLRMVASKPLPFPPEPLRWTGITATRVSLARADADGGRRNLWLRALDRVGLGFDS